MKSESESQTTSKILIFILFSTGDWSLSINGTTPAIVAQKLQTWITGPKSPGLIILEHELTTESVNAFMNAYPLMKSNKWKLPSVAQIATSVVDNTTGNAWWNAPNGNQGPVTSSTFGYVAVATSLSSSGSESETTPLTTGQPARTSATSSSTLSPHKASSNSAISSSIVSIYTVVFSVLLSALGIL
jgi:chitin deacetylase